MKEFLMNIGSLTVMRIQEIAIHEYMITTVSGIHEIVIQKYMITSS